MTPDAILALQRTAGNRAVASLLSPTVQRVKETKAGQFDRLSKAIGHKKAQWISDHPTEKVSAWSGKSNKDLNQFKQMSVADFKLAFAVPSQEPAPEASPAVGGGGKEEAVELPPAPPPSSEKPVALAGPNVPIPTPITPVALPPSSTPIPTPITPVALAPPSVPIPAPITPEGEFATRLAAFKVTLAAVMAAEADKFKVVAQVGAKMFGTQFRWNDFGVSAYTNALKGNPAIGKVKVSLETVKAQVDHHAARADIDATKKLSMITHYEGEVDKQKQVLATVEPTAQAHADALASSTYAHYDPAPPASAPTQQGIFNFLTTDVAKHLVNAGERRSDYRSSHDKGEHNTFGASYKLENTPFVLHLHVAGSGTQLSAMSVKWETNEYGGSVIPNGWIKGTALETSLQGTINRAAETPRDIGLARRAGTPAKGRTW